MSLPGVVSFRLSLAQAFAAAEPAGLAATLALVEVSSAGAQAAAASTRAPDASRSEGRRITASIRGSFHEIR
nr:hypothetical protein [Microbispora sp. GKU 823]